jgi:hypothetical protein
MSEITDHEGENAATLTRYCRRCHRKLKSERSMKLGFGPICIMKEAQEAGA